MQIVKVNFLNKSLDGREAIGRPCETERIILK